MTERQTWIEDRISEGRTVFITTYTRSTKITPRNFKAWANRGTPLITNDGKSTYMAEGKGRVCIDFCKISAR